VRTRHPNLGYPRFGDVKRWDLLRRIAKRAKQCEAVWEFDGAGSRHDIWILNNQKIPVPRHSEIGEGLAESIFKQCEFALGERWWK